MRVDFSKHCKRLHLYIVQFALEVLPREFVQCTPEIKLRDAARGATYRR